jgi:hypothetical protein
MQFRSQFVPWRTAVGAAIVSALALTCAGIAHADNIVDTIESSGAIALVAGDAASSGSGQIKVVSSNGQDGDPACNIDPGEQLVLNLVTPAGVTATPASLTFTVCDIFQSVSFNAASNAASGPFTVTATIGTNTTGVGSYNNNVSIPITVTSPVIVVTDADHDGIADSADNCPATANADQADADADGLGNVCDENSYAPVTDTLPADEDGYEGSGLTTDGAFTDADGNGTLSITKVSGAGTVTDNGDGTWSWSHSTTDDANGTVVVRATDGEHNPATETFNWNAANVAPSVGPVTATRDGACAVTVNAPFTDPGSADTHTASIAWGDNSANTDVDPATSAITASHTFGASGTYTVGVTVTDDDGGHGSAGKDFTAFNTPSSILQPINAAGTRSVFKLGSTIPIKITVLGCSGGAVSTLTPKVSLARIDTTPDGTVNETALDTVATNGLTMRWSDTQYIYNLSTKLSQQTGAALTAGTYKVTVSDSSFAEPVTAQFDLRK